MFKDNKHYTYQKLKRTQIIVETANFDVETLMSKELAFKRFFTGGDGHYGDIIEFKDGNILEGISISLSTGDLCTFEEIKTFTEYLFDCKFND